MSPKLQRASVFQQIQGGQQTVLHSSGLINVAQWGVKVILLLAYEANVIVNVRDFGGSLTQSLSSGIESGCEQILAANWRR